MDENESTQQAPCDAAARESEEAAWLEMLADADEQSPETAAIARDDRAVALVLEWEAESLRARAAQRNAPVQRPDPDRG